MALRFIPGAIFICHGCLYVLRLEIAKIGRFDG